VSNRTSSTGIMCRLTTLFPSGLLKERAENFDVVERDSKLSTSPMETLLPTQTTVYDKIVMPSWCLLPTQPIGGPHLDAVRSLSGQSSGSRSTSTGH
jgi:hypothetical protein